MIQSAIVFITPAITGSLGILLLKRNSKASLPDRFLDIFLGTAIGYGLISIAFFAWSLFFSPSSYQNVFMTAELAALVLLTVYGLWKSRHRFRMRPKISVRAPHVLDSILLLVFIIVLLFSLASFINSTMQYPYGKSDGITSWNLRARFMARGGESWFDVFSPVLIWTAPDYPFLLPGNIARVWVLTNDTSNLIPALFAGLFTYATVGLVVSAIWSFRSFRQSMLAGILLLATPYFTILGSSQYGDIPYSFYLLAASVCFYRYSIQPDSKLYLILSGLLAGLSIWTKYEGLIFLIAIVISAVVFLLVKRNMHHLLQEGLYFAGGLLIVVPFLLYLNLSLAPPSYMVKGLSPDPGIPTLFERLIDSGRYIYITEYLLIYLLTFGGWKVPLLLVLIVFYLMVGKEKLIRDKSVVAFLAVVLLLICIGYYGTYLISPLDVVTHVSHSLTRIYMHIYPTIIFLFFLFIKDLGKAISGHISTARQSEAS